MPSERIQRRVDTLLDEADTAVSAGQWSIVAEKARAVLAIDETNQDALAFPELMYGQACGQPFEWAEAKQVVPFRFGVPELAKIGGRKLANPTVRQ